MKYTILLLMLTTCLSVYSQEEDVKSVFVCPPCGGDCDMLEFEKPGSCSHCGMQLMEKDLNTNKLKTMTIAFYLQDGVEILDFAGPMEVFAYSGYEVFTVSKTKAPIKTQGILTIIPDYSIKDAPKADIMAFFGGNSKAAYGDQEVIEWVKSRQETDHYFSVCTGAFVLGESGILDGKTATTFHDALDQLESNYANTKVLKDVRFVDNGNVITTAGISAGIDGALHLVAKQKGINTARKTAYYMEYDKWLPGEGLILADENPYENIPGLDYLNAFPGTYENPDGDTFEVSVNEREKVLYITVSDRKIPLFYDHQDLFLSPLDHKINFLRNEKNTIIGFKQKDEKDVIYQKIK